MFGALKDKLKGALSSFSKKVSEEGKQEETEVDVPVQDASQESDSTPVEENNVENEETKESFTESKTQDSDESKPKTEEIADLDQELTEEPEQETSEEKTGFFSKIKKAFTDTSELEEIDKEEAKEPVVEQKTEVEPVEETAVPIDSDHKEEPAEEDTPSQETADANTESSSEPTKVVEEENQAQEVVPKPVVKESEDQKQEKPTKTAIEQVPEQSLTKEEKPTEPITEEKQEPVEEKKGFFSKLKERVTTTTITEEQFDDMFYDIELAMLENNVAVEVIDKIKQDLTETVVNTPIARGQVEQQVISSFKDSVQALFEDSFDLLAKIKEKQDKPYVISFLGINGSGKTTSIAKMTQYLKNQGLTVVLAAGDTFRAASIEQLSLHADKLGVKVIKHDYGSDPAAVAFDAIKHAQAKNVDVVLIDTAGRMHKNENLMQEMEKIVRVAKPDLKIFVGESITGNDCVEQAQSFNDTVGLDGIILSKTDIDEKGGAFVSVSYVTKKPILFIGTGQEYSDFKAFNPSIVMENLGLA